MDINNAMVRFAFSVGDTTTHAVYQLASSKTHRIGDAKHNIYCTYCVGEIGYEVDCTRSRMATSNTIIYCLRCELAMVLH